MAEAIQQRLPCPTYDGRVYDPSAARAFLAEYDVYAEAYALTDAQKLSTLQTALKGEANLWLLSDIDMSPPEQRTWTTARANFIAHFTAPVPRASRAIMAAECRQKPNEGIRNFLTRCSRVAFETTSTPDELPATTRRMRPDDAAADAPRVTVTIRPNAADIAAARRFWATDKAMDLFVAGCHEKIRLQLAMDRSWATWQELSDRAIAIEQSLAPQALDRQIHPFRAHVNAVADQPQQPQPPQQQPNPPAPTNAIGNGGRAGANRANGHGQANNRQQQQQRRRGGKPGVKPDPQQQPSHRVPIICDYCGGKFHIASSCLAKQKAEGQPGNVYALDTAAAAAAAHMQPLPQQPPMPAATAHQFLPADPMLWQQQQQAAAAVPYPQFQPAAPLAAVAPWQYPAPGFPHGGE